MALNLSKLKKDTTTEESSEVSSLNLSSLKKAAPKSATANTKPLNLDALKSNLESEEQQKPEENQSFTLTFVEKKVYDLDEMIEKKRRNNPDKELILQVNLAEDITNTIIDMVTQKILDTYKVTYDTNPESNLYFKKRISSILNFEVLFDRYFERYYNRYLEEINKPEYDGSVSIDTILRKINVTKEDVRNYTLQDVADNETRFINLYDKNKPLVIWTDGTPDPGCGEIPTIVYTDELLDYLYSMLNSSDSNRLEITKTEEGKLEFTVANIIDKIETNKDGSLNVPRNTIPTTGAIYSFMTRVNTSVTYESDNDGQYGVLNLAPTAVVSELDDGSYAFDLSSVDEYSVVEIINEDGSVEYALSRNTI